MFKFFIKYVEINLFFCYETLYICSEFNQFSLKLFLTI